MAVCLFAVSAGASQGVTDAVRCSRYIEDGLLRMLVDCGHLGLTLLNVKTSASL